MAEILISEALLNRVGFHNADIWVQPLRKAAGLYQIDNRARTAAFLAQVGHESGRLRYAREIWGPTRAQTRYEGRKDLGNTEPGDGKRYLGRGLIQVTGRNNYRRFTQRIRERFTDAPDFEANPVLLTQPLWAALSAGDFWDRMELNPLADRMEITLITRRINGGLNGLAERKALWNKLLQLLPT